MDNEICKIAIRRFLERFRKKNKKSIKHFIATEIGSGGTERIHMHGILFSNEKKEEIAKFWKYGFIDIKDKTNKGVVNERTINYITKYITKTDEIHKEYKPIILATAGLGKKYIERHIVTGKQIGRAHV